MSNLALKAVVEQGDCVSLLAMLKQMSDEKKNALVHSADFNEIFKRALEDENWPIVQCFLDIQSSTQVMQDDNKQGKRIAALPDRPLRMFVDELTKDEKDSLADVKGWILSGLKNHKRMVAEKLKSIDTKPQKGNPQSQNPPPEAQKEVRGETGKKDEKKEEPSSIEPEAPSATGSYIDQQVDAIMDILFRGSKKVYNTSDDDNEGSFGSGDSGSGSSDSYSDE